MTTIVAGNFTEIYLNPYNQIGNTLFKQVSDNILSKLDSNQDQKTKQIDVYRKTQELAIALVKLNDLNQWPENWDGYGSAKPIPINLLKAKQVLLDFYNNNLLSKLDVLMPAISAGPEGEVIFEWWYGQKQLNLSINAKDILYIKAASDKISEMEDGKLQELDDISFYKLFGWLIG